MMRLKINSNYIFIFLFVLLYFYFFLWFDSSLYYHFHQILFLFDLNFLKEFTLYPGGLTESVFQFFLQFFNFNWFGSLLISTLFISIFSLVYRILKGMGAFNQPFLLAFIPVALLLGLQNQVRFPLLIPVKYLLLLIFFLVYTRSAKGYKAAMIILSCSIYYLLGGWFFLWYIFFCVLYEILFPRYSGRFVYAAACLLAGLVYPFIASRFVFLITLKEAYLYSVPYECYFEPDLFKPDFYFYVFFLSLPALLTVCFVYMKFFRPRMANDNKFRTLLGHWMTQGAVAVLVGGLSLISSFNLQEKKKIQIDRLAEQDRWQELLMLCGQIKEYDRLVNFQINRALYHTGQLLDNLFAFDQQLGSDGLFIDRIIGSQIAMPASDLYLDLGNINASQAMAFEAETKFRYNPRVLKRLFLTHLINEKYAAAQKYSALLGKSILHRKWIDHYQRLLRDSTATPDPFIQVKRRQRPKIDFFIDNKNPNRGLIRMFKENPDNKMALEYLTAYHLLECRVGNLVEYLDQFGKLGHRGFPRAVEEAILLLNLISPSEINIKKYNIHVRTVKRFWRFNMILARYKTNQAEARESLKTEFRDTYWYYAFFMNPNKSKQKLIPRKIDEELY